MEELKKYLCELKYTSIDITKLVTTTKSLSKYYIKRPKVILIVKRTKETREIFEDLNRDEEYALLTEKKIFTIDIDEKLTDMNKRHIEKTLGRELECNICMTNKQVYIACRNCIYNMCFDCIDKIKTDTSHLSDTINMIVKCPQCREFIIISDKYICTKCKKIVPRTFGHSDSCKHRICEQCIMSKES